MAYASTGGGAASARSAAAAASASTSGSATSASCKECSGGGQVTFLEAAEVEAFDGEDDLEDCAPTVQARVVGGPRGGKRKR